MIWRKTIVASSVALLLASAMAPLALAEQEKHAGYQYRVPERTDDGWDTAPATSESMDPKLIAELFQRLNDRAYTNINSLLLVRGTKLVAEEYFAGKQPVIGDTLEQEPDWTGKYQAHDRDTLHTLQSATKSISSILIGIAIDRGLIRGVDEKISAFFPEFPRKDTLRLKHFLSMTAGLEWNEHEIPINDPRNDCNRMNHTNDPVRLLLERPIVRTPGAQFAYNSAISVALGEIIRRASGLPVDKFAQTNLFQPLGISSIAWKGRFCSRKNSPPCIIPTTFNRTKPNGKRRTSALFPPGTPREDRRLSGPLPGY